MKIELILKTRNPNKTRDFYSALGIKWLGGEDLVDEIQEYEDGNMGLPDLVGIIGNVEISFYIDRNFVGGNICSPLIAFNPVSSEEFESIIMRLKEDNLYVKTENSKPFIQETLLDPDGHRIAICPIDPFKNFRYLTEIVNRKVGDDN